MHSGGLRFVSLPASCFLLALRFTAAAAWAGVSVPWFQPVIVVLASLKQSLSSVTFSISMQDNNIKNISFTIVSSCFQLAMCADEGHVEANFRCKSKQIRSECFPIGCLLMN